MIRRPRIPATCDLTDGGDAAAATTTSNRVPSYQ
jgi:hypothetical protein